MFKAQIDYRGASYYSSELYADDADSVFKIQSCDDGYRCVIPAQVNIAAFKPFLFRREIITGVTIKKKLLGANEEIPNRDWVDVSEPRQSLIYVFVPEAHGRSQYAASTLRSLLVNVPFEALQQLSVLAARTGAIIDLTAAGQESISSAFTAKSGLFAPDSTAAIVLDPSKSLQENGIDALKPKPFSPIR